MKHAYLACAAALLATGAVHAEQVAFRFTGVITNSGAFNVPVGAEASAIVSYDTDTAPSGNTGPFGHPGAMKQLVSFDLTGKGSLAADLGGKPLTTDTMAVSMIDSLESLKFERLGISGAGIKLDGQAYDKAYFVINLDSTGPGDVLNAVLPASISLTDFQSDYPFSFGALYMGDGQDSSTLVFSLTSITAVPEPATFVSVSVGLLVLLGLRRRQELLGKA